MRGSFLWAIGALAVLLPRLAGAAPFVYVANADSDDVTVIDAATNTVVTTIGVGEEPRNPGVSQDGTRVYVPNRKDDNGVPNPDGSLTVINGVTNTVITTITDTSSFDEPYSASVSPDGTFVYVANKKGGGSSVGSVTVIDATNNTVSTTIIDDCFVSPEWVTFNHAGTRAYVPNRQGDSVCVVSTATNTVVDEVDVGSEPRSAIVSCDDAFLYVANNGGSPDVTKIRTADNSVVGAINFPSGSARNMSITPDGTKIYVGLQNANVGVINTGTDTPSTIAIPNGDSIYATAVIADGTHVYATDEDDDEVEVIKLPSGTVLTGTGLPIGAGNTPRGVATRFMCSPGPVMAPAASRPVLLALLSVLAGLGVWSVRRRPLR